MGKKNSAPLHSGEHPSALRPGASEGLQGPPGFLLRLTGHSGSQGPGSSYQSGIPKRQEMEGGYTARTNHRAVRYCSVHLQVDSEHCMGDL